jgi:CrcB protein
LIAEAAPVAPGALPVTTLAVNVAGALALGALVAAVAGRGRWWVRPLLGTGVLGGFTTFSTFAVETDRLLALGELATAGAYVSASLALGVAAALAGEELVRRLVPVGAGRG